jgi:uncharacterized protein
MERLVVWRGLDAWRADGAYVRIEDGRMSAHGTQLGAVPYRLDYHLRTGPDFVTETLELSMLRGGALNRLVLARDPDGGWTADDRPLPDVAGALDCDLGLCPLTNTMPVLRGQLLRPGAEPVEFVMAWVAVPDLTVHRSGEGLVVRYPELAERVSSAP